MALWGFSKKKKAAKNNADPLKEQTADQEAARQANQSVTDNSALEDEAAASVEHVEPVAATNASGVNDAAGETGPFDGDTVDINEFDFGDFSAGILDLGSVKIAIPKDSQVQVEMGEKGPKMLHLVTHYGRMTPIAFAAPSSAGQWDEAAEEIAATMKQSGADVSFEHGPWGREVVSEHNQATTRVIGAEKPRWMLRVTLAGPADRAEKLAELAREVIARTFVYRGQQPILAGNSLPVTMPASLMQQVQQAMQQRQAQSQQQSPGVAEASQSLRNIADDTSTGTAADTENQQTTQAQNAPSTAQNSKEQR